MISNLELARVMLALVYLICLLGAIYVIRDFVAFMRAAEVQEAFDKHVDDALLNVTP